MATNKKKIFITESMSRPGRALLNARDDIETIEFPNLISARDFEAMLSKHAPVHGVALGATRFGEPELEACRDMKVVTRIGVGYDAVDVAALSRRKIPLMVAGTANSPSVAEHAGDGRHVQFGPAQAHETFGLSGQHCARRYRR